MFRLSICIPVYNKYAFTKSCLDDLYKLPEDHEIIIIDNGSTDDTESLLKNNNRIKYIRNDNNLGFARACNQGYAAAQSDKVLFLNNDIRVKSNHDNWTNLLIEKCDEGLVGPTMGQLDSELNFVKESNSVLNGNSYMSGWCLASSKSNFDKLNIKRKDSDLPQIFSEEFGIAYFEDTDLSFRAKQLNIKMNVVDIPVVHFGKISSKQLNTYQLYSKAKVIFYNKWHNI
jgi:GT2 family glycosyltransferase